MPQNALMNSPAPPEMASQPGQPGGGGNALAPPNAQQPQQSAPAPSHQQVVTALRHFDAIEKELTSLLKNPDCGKADLHSEIVDGATKLVAGGFMTAVQAVEQLGKIPERPFEQREYLEKQLAQTVMAANAILDHHGAAFQGQQVDTAMPDPDTHANDMSGIMAHYSRATGHG